jgi:hypothetical protein
LQCRGLKNRTRGLTQRSLRHTAVSASRRCSARALCPAWAILAPVSWSAGAVATSNSHQTKSKAASVGGFLGRNFARSSALIPRVQRVFSPPSSGESCCWSRRDDADTSRENASCRTPSQQPPCGSCFVVPPAPHVVDLATGNRLHHQCTDSRADDEANNQPPKNPMTHPRSP